MGLSYTSFAPRSEAVIIQPLTFVPIKYPGKPGLNLYMRGILGLY